MQKYDSYKSSGIEWIGEIPSHWEVATIGRLTNIGRGRVISAIEISQHLGIYPVYSSQTENNGVMGLLDTFDFEGKYVTWTTDGANAGTVFYREGKFNCTNVCGTIQPKNWEQINLKFLPYYLNLGTKNYVRLDINPKLMNNMMAAIPLIVPPLAEQQAIADYLDRKTAEIDSLISDKKQLLALYEAEKTAIINNAVTKGIKAGVAMRNSGVEWLGEIPSHWGVKKIKYVAELKSGNAIVSEQIKDDSAYPVFGGNGLRGYFDDFTHEGEFILIGRQGAYCGNIKYSKGKFWASEHAVVLKPIINYNLVYLGELLRVMNLGQYSVAAAQPGLAVESIKQLQIPFPTQDEQNKIADYIEGEVSRIAAKVSNVNQLISLLEEYRSALISEVVTGKVRVV